MLDQEEFGLDHKNLMMLPYQMYQVTEGTFPGPKPLSDWPSYLL